MNRFPEVRIADDLAQQVDARLAQGQTWSSLVRDALTVYLTDGAKPKPRRRRTGAVLKALNVALSVVAFEDRDAGAIGLARHLAERLDDRPADAKYLAARLLSVLIELKLTPAARLGVLSATPTRPEIAGPMDDLRLMAAAPRCTVPGLRAYLCRLDDRHRELTAQLSGPDVAERFYDGPHAEVEAVTLALPRLEDVTKALERPPTGRW